MQQTFGKHERLCSQKLIDSLYQSGHKLMVFPYSIRWQLVEKETFESPAQVLISTSKKKFHHAVDRNRVKRLTRECYRLHKPQLYQLLADRDIKMVLSINYIHNAIMDYAVLYHKFDKVVAHLTADIEKLSAQ